MDSLPIVEGLECADTACPCPSYPALRAEWFAAALQHLEDAECEIDEDAAAFVEDGMTLFLEAAGAAKTPWQSRPVAARAAHVAALLAKPNVGQRTQEWYAQSRNVLTASEFSAILGTPRAFGVLAQSKAAPLPDAVSGPARLACSTLEMSPMDWGVRFEPVVKQVLEARWGASIVDVGRLLHPTMPHLAASPDGLIREATDPARVGRLVEIKCPVKRAITGEIPFEYWCQMQIQMEVTDIDECEYVEVKLAAAYKAEPAATAPSDAVAGTLWLLQHPDTLELKYAFTEAERVELEACEWNVMETIPWAVETIATKVVVRDRAWFASTLQKQGEFWEAVTAVRAGTYVMPASSRPVRAAAASLSVKPIVTVCKIED